MYCSKIAGLIIFWLVASALLSIFVDWIEHKIHLYKDRKKYEKMAKKYAIANKKLNKENKYLRNYIKELEFGDEETDGDSDETN